MKYWIFPSEYKSISGHTWLAVIINMVRDAAPRNIFCFLTLPVSLSSSPFQIIKAEKGLIYNMIIMILDHQYYLWFLATQLGMRLRPMWNSSHILWSGIFASTSGQWSLPLVILRITKRRTQHLWQKRCIPKQEAAYLWNSTQHDSIIVPQLQIELEQACGQNFYFW